MNINNFHKTFYDHLRNKREDVGQILALDSNLEKWFQGEMVLAFSDRRTNFRIFSSELYNEDADDIDDKSWNAYLAKKGIVTIEGNIYKAVKIGKKEITGARKADFILESSEEFICSETKILWFCKNLNPLNESNVSNDFLQILNNYFEKKNVFEDAWRMKKNLYKEFSGYRKPIQRYLSFISIFDCQIGNDFKMLKERMASLINNYFESDSIINNPNSQIKIDIICNYSTDYSNLSQEIAGWSSKEYFVYLMTIDLK